MIIWKIYWSPIQAFQENGWGRSWLAILGALSVGSYLLGFLMQPFIERVTLLQLQKLLPVEEAYLALQQHSGWKTVGVVLTPVYLLGRASFYGGIATAFSVLSGSAPQFHRMLFIVLAASISQLLKGLCTYTILMLKGLDQIRETADLQPGLGVDLILDTPSVLANSFIRGLNLFDCWYAVILFIGFWKGAKLDRTLSATITLTIWGIGLLFEAQTQLFLDKFNRFIP